MSPRRGASRSPHAGRKRPPTAIPPHILREMRPRQRAPRPPHTPATRRDQERGGIDNGGSSGSVSFGNVDRVSDSSRGADMGGSAPLVPSIHGEGGSRTNRSQPSNEHGSAGRAFASVNQPLASRRHNIMGGRSSLNIEDLMASEFPPRNRQNVGQVGQGPAGRASGASGQQPRASNTPAGPGSRGTSQLHPNNRPSGRDFVATVQLNPNNRPAGRGYGGPQAPGFHPMAPLSTIHGQAHSQQTAFAHDAGRGGLQTGIPGQLRGSTKEDAIYIPASPILGGGSSMQTSTQSGSLQHHHRPQANQGSQLGRHEQNQTWSTGNRNVGFGASIDPGTCFDMGSPFPLEPDDSLERWVANQRLTDPQGRHGSHSGSFTAQNQIWSAGNSNVGSASSSGPGLSLRQDNNLGIYNYITGVGAPQGTLGINTASLPEQNQGWGNLGGNAGLNVPQGILGMDPNFPAEQTSGVYGVVDNLNVGFGAPMGPGADFPPQQNQNWVNYSDNSGLSAPQNMLDMGVDFPSEQTQDVQGVADPTSQTGENANTQRPDRWAWEGAWEGDEVFAEMAAANRRMYHGD